MLTGEYDLLADNMTVTNILAALLLILPIIFIFLNKKWLIGLYAVSIVANLPLVFFMSFKFSYELIIALALIIKIAIDAYKEKSLLYITTRENIYLIGSLLIVVIVNLLTSLFNFNRDQFLLRVMIYAVNIFILFIFTYFAKTRDLLGVIKNAVVLGGALLAVSAVAEMVYGHYVLDVANMRPAGLLLDPNVCAFALNATLAISLYNPRKPTIMRAFFLIAFRVLIVFGVFLTVSRSGYIGSAVILVFMLFYYSRKGENWVAAAAVTAFILIYFIFYNTAVKFWGTIHGIIDLDRIFPYTGGPVIPTEGGPTGTPSSIFSGERIALALAALRIFFRNLFSGVGIGNVLPEIAAYTGVGLESHNFVLQLLAESGVLMLAALLLLGYFIIRLLLNASPRIRWFFALILLVVAVEALFNHNLLNLNLVWFALAFVLAVNATYSKRKIDIGISRGRRR